jgi:hypothetical protein
MATEKQIAANRLNAQKSTGPQCRFHSSTSTPEGRAAVRLNGVTHGLTAETLVLKGESESDFKAVFDSFEAEYQPETSTEETLVAQLAMATWRLRRVYNMEAGYYAKRLSEMAKYAAEEKLEHAKRLGIAANTDSNPIAMIGRQEARLERTYYRALHELQRLRKEREANLALVGESEVEQDHALPGKQTTNIPPAPDPAPAIPAEPMVNSLIPTDPPSGQRPII